MKIVTFEPKLFRWEYELVESIDTFSARRRWFLFHDDISAPVCVRSLAEAAEQLTDRNHPAWMGLQNILMGTRDTVELLPWRPFESSPQVLQALGPHAIERVESKNREFKVCCSVDHRVWLHVPGDAAIDRRSSPQSTAAPETK